MKFLIMWFYILLSLFSWFQIFLSVRPQTTLLHVLPQERTRLPHYRARDKIISFYILIFAFHTGCVKIQDSELDCSKNFPNLICS
jgi:hypothetical protein